MEKKRCNRQIALVVILLALVLAFLGLLVWKLTSDWRQRGRVEDAVIELTPTATHSQEELDAAAEAVLELFPGTYYNRSLIRLRYDPAQGESLERQVCEDTNLPRQRVIVLLADTRPTGSRVQSKTMDWNLHFMDLRLCMIWREDQGWVLSNDLIASRELEYYRSQIPADANRTVTPPPTPTP